MVTERVGVIGAGPVGLYAALRLIEAGYEVKVWEKGAEVGWNVKSWGFVELFSKTGLNVPAEVRRVLVDRAVPDDESYVSGAVFRDEVLAPLAAALEKSGKCEVATGCEVVGVGRGRLLKGEGIAALGEGDARRRAPFRVCVFDAETGRETVETCWALVDASGTYSADSALRSGLGGVSAPGEADAERRGSIARVIPDPSRFASSVKGMRVAVLGAGFSAVTTLRLLATCPPDVKPASVAWIVRSKSNTGGPYAVSHDDPLPQRAALSKFGNALAADAPHKKVLDNGAQFECIRGAGVVAFETAADDGALVVRLEDDCPDAPLRALVVDRLFSLTGYRPRTDYLSELQIHVCYASDGPMKLAATLLAAKAGGGTASADCLAQAAPGPATLQNPEPGLFIIGMRSYGRNSSFLMRVGYEQVDLLVAALADFHGQSHPPTSASSS